MRALSGALSLGAIVAALTVLAVLVAITLLAAFTAIAHVGAFDAELRSATERTLLYAFSTAALQVAIALVVAMACLPRWPVNGAVLTILLLPYFIPSTLVHAGFQLLFLPEGAGALVFEAAGVPRQFWFQDDGRFVRLLMASIWQFWPFAFLLAMARLLSVQPAEARALTLAARTPTQGIVIIGLRHLLLVGAALFAARLMFMASKFDLPYLASNEGTHERNLLTVEIWRGLSRFGARDPDLPIRAASAPTLVLLAFAALTAIAIAGATFLHRRARMRAAPEAAAAVAGPLLDLVQRPLGLVALIAGAAFVLAPLLALAGASVSADTAIQRGWQPDDVWSSFTPDHFAAIAEVFIADSADNWLAAFGRTMLLSSSVAFVAAALATIAGAWLAVHARSLGLATQLLAVAAFGIPTMIWIFVLAWSDAGLSAWLPTGMCTSSEGRTSLVQGCGSQLMWGLHLVFTTSIAVYMATAFWARSTSPTELRALLLQGIDARKPTHLLVAMLLARRQYAGNVFWSVFPIVFAVSWSDISFSRFFADSGTRLFVDLAAMRLGLESPGGTTFGQMGVAALLAFVIALVMARLVRAGLR